MASRLRSSLYPTLRNPRNTALPAQGGLRYQLAWSFHCPRTLVTLSLRAPKPLAHTSRSIVPPSRKRRLSTSPALRQLSNSQVVQSFPDSDRPDVFYHLFAAPTAISPKAAVYAVSFLDTPPPHVLSDAVIGWLPAEAGEDSEAGLNDFVENDRFRDALHEAVKSGLRDGVDEVQANGATQMQAGWMHIHDSRNLPPLGRIGDPDDILATVLVEDGKILAETYQPMPAYRLCTSDGVLQLTDGLAARLKEVLLARVGQEQS